MQIKNKNYKKDSRENCQKITCVIRGGLAMAGKYDALADIIVKNVGGKDNISNLTHCVTRLRFNLREEYRQGE